MLSAQPACPDTPVYSPCDLVFELNADEAAAHPTPYTNVELYGEFRSPSASTFLMHGFWDGDRRFVVRITPTEPGRWDYRLTSNVARLNGQQGSFQAVPSDAKGFVAVANVRHFAYEKEGNAWPEPHLWMGDTSYRFAVLDRALFDLMVTTRAAQKFNHIRGLVMGNLPGLDQAFSDPDTPNPAYFRELDNRIRYMNERGIVADLVLAGDQNDLADRFPTRAQRERYVRYVVARYAPMNITWQGVQEFEEYDNARALLREIGDLLKELDPYHHIRSTHTTASSSPLLDDGWMDYIAYQTSDEALTGIEHQLYGRPQVNTEFGYEDSGAGRSQDHHVDTDTFRKRLWRTTMDGVYPTYGNTGTYGGRDFVPSAKYLDAPGAQQMAHWYDFFDGTRYWELEPYFDVDGGRALYLTGIEYIVYIENPGPVELLTEKKEYNVYWFNPITGEYVIPKKKKWKGERFAGEPPTLDHDWVLHLSRDGRKKNMAERWHFESRRVVLQEVERNPARLPFEIVEPIGETLSAGEPVSFSVRLTRESRATSRMLYLWTGEVAASGEGARILATGAEGTFRIPPDIVGGRGYLLNLRLIGMNALGKVYSINRVYKLNQ